MVYLPTFGKKNMVNVGKYEGFYGICYGGETSLIPFI